MTIIKGISWLGKTSNEYLKYKNLLKETGTKFGQELGESFEIIPTSKKLCRKVGLQQETANCINTAEYIKAIFKLLKEKGYEMPKVYIDESVISRKHNFVGLQQGDFVIFGPGQLPVLEPSAAIHEQGHFLHKKNMWYNDQLYAMFSSFRSVFRPILNRKEREILTSDFKRAYEQGYFRHLDWEANLKMGYCNEKSINKFRKAPEKNLVSYSLSNMQEFIAEYFMLASCGFKFSPEITKRYKAFHGPEIKKLITPEEIDKLVEYRRSLEKRLSVEI